MLRSTGSARQLRGAAIDRLADAVEDNLDLRPIFELIKLSPAIASALRA
jgi:hypothetical protein